MGAGNLFRSFPSNHGSGGDWSRNISMLPDPQASTTPAPVAFTISPGPAAVNGAGPA